MTLRLIYFPVNLVTYIADGAYNGNVQWADVTPLILIASVGFWIGMVVGGILTVKAFL